MSTLTIDILREAINKIPEDPYEKLANDNGFSFAAGDKLILPIEFEGKVSHPGFVFSHYADTGYFIKSSLIGIRPREFLKKPQWHHPIYPNPILSGGATS